MSSFSRVSWSRVSKPHRAFVLLMSYTRWRVTVDDPPTPHGQDPLQEFIMQGSAHKSSQRQGPATWALPNRAQQARARRERAASGVQWRGRRPTALHPRLDVDTLPYRLSGYPVPVVELIMLMGILYFPMLRQGP